MTGDAVAIIPARAGSKRIPGKNIRLFNGLPMIAHTLQAVQLSGMFRKVLVSTDSDEIAAIAERFGAECPFRRPADLANDTASTAAVVLHALDWLAECDEVPTAICCLYATAPFIQPADIRRGYDILSQAGCGSAFTVTSFDAPIFRALRVTAQGALAMIWPDYEMCRSQDLPEALHDAGQFYWLDSARFRAEKRIYCTDLRPILLPRWRVQDIDTPEDWQRAELLHTLLQDSSLRA